MQRFKLNAPKNRPVPGGKDKPPKSLIELPAVAPIHYYRQADDDSSFRYAITCWQYALNIPCILQAHEEFGIVSGFTIEHHAAERKTAFARGVWKRDRSAIRQVIKAINPAGLAENLFNKYTTTHPTRIERDGPTWADGTYETLTLSFEPEPAALVIFSREPVSGFAIAGESLKGRMRQAAVTSIVRRTESSLNSAATITFNNEFGLFAPGYRPRLGRGPELNLSSLTLNADGTIAGFTEVS